MDRVDVQRSYKIRHVYTTVHLWHNLYMYKIRQSLYLYPALIAGVIYIFWVVYAMEWLNIHSKNSRRADSKLHDLLVTRIMTLTLQEELCIYQIYMSYTNHHINQHSILRMI